MPKYPGGDQELLKYLAANLKYPIEAQQNKIEGKVYIRFIVTEDGDIDKATVMKSLNKECDEEALRVIKGMPKWEPGKQNGVNASVYYVIPFHFSLNKNKTITTELLWKSFDVAYDICVNYGGLLKEVKEAKDE